MTTFLNNVTNKLNMSHNKNITVAWIAIIMFFNVAFKCSNDKSFKYKSIYKLCVWIPEEPNCLLYNYDF